MPVIDVFNTEQSTNSIITLEDQLWYLPSINSGIVRSIISPVSTFNSSVICFINHSSS